ncbi:MAG: hypothetical protein HKO66_08095 [Saprospiraceae bacterium]|nr:hypothetical protein [Bacteroidia bacterium]NNE14235.1 hypothetical protein [Saprospiraceae bacterium]NNL92178.1 hypothetical protein [Saprospiraceae bacterium]
MTEEVGKPEKSGKRLSKNILNIIRTTMRNNIELTHIADNKANVLLSLNALMLTFLIPSVISNIDLIKERHLGIPLLIIIVTCMVTIYLSALVLKPGDFDKYKLNHKNTFVSPFFFGNYYKMTSKEYDQYITDAVSKEMLVRRHITQDLYYIGSRLGQKMSIIRNAFNIFLSGLILSIVAAAVAVLFFN